MSLSQLASMAVPLCQPANEHAHRSTVGELSMRAGVPDNLQAASMKPTCRASVERNAAAEAVNTEALQPELVTRPPSTAESSEAELQLEQGLEKPQDAPQVAAKPAALEIPVSPVLPAVPEEGADLVLALVKEESLKESPAWKVRAAREAAQHAGNTLFPDICQPGTVSDRPCTQRAKPAPPFLSCDQCIVVLPAKSGSGCILPVADNLKGWS